MSDRFFFSLEGVDINDEDALEAFASQVWERVTAAWQSNQLDEANGKESDMKTQPVHLTERYADAVAYASSLHAAQVRKSTTIPYISHLLSVSSLVLEAGGDEDMAIAALLHDGPEDQGGQVVLDDIRERFGDRVAHIVQGCSDSLAEDPKQKEPWRVRKERYLNHLAEADDDTVTVSLADKLHNARAIVSDLRITGPDTWSRFNAPPAGILWYYEQIVAIAQGRQANPFLVTNLSEAVATMTRNAHESDG